MAARPLSTLAVVKVECIRMWVRVALPRLLATASEVIIFLQTALFHFW
jgi:hypothetical protein